MSATAEHINGHTYHGRKGETSNSFRYSIDYVLLDAETKVPGPSLFGRNSRGLASLYDSDHGGAPGDGRGATWVREVLEAHDLQQPTRIDLLAQPRMWGHVFNPVSFWLCWDDTSALRTVIAEVTNTYGDRHSYLCVKPDGSAIGPQDRLAARKIFHVSPFQPVEGGYIFRFDITPERLGIFIDYTSQNGGLIATLTGPRAPLSNWSIVKACIRRPLGSRRVLGLIHWQALKLWWKGARFRSRPETPQQEIS